MKLELFVNDMDVKVELDGSNVDQLESLETVKTLIDTLSQYDFVKVHIEKNVNHDFPDADPM